jgi:integrase/recombinase XerD
MTTVSAILPAGHDGTLNLAGQDAETRAVWAFLARYRNDRTRLNYKHDIDQFARWVRYDADLPSLLHVTRMHAELYLRHLQRAGYAEATVCRRFGTIRMFYKYAVIDDVIVKDPTVAVESPKIDHDAQRRTWLTTLQFSKLLNYSRGNPRSHAMVCALGMMGMRIAEMCSLDVTDVQRLIGAANVTFVGKGGRTFTLDLPLEVLTAFDRISAGRTTGPLFLTRDTGTRWLPADVRRHLATLVRQAGLGDVDITPHGLRRTAARTLAERGVELGAIQEFLRHKDPRVTKLCYIGPDSGAGSLARQLLAGVYSNTAR